MCNKMIVSLLFTGLVIAQVQSQQRVGINTLTPDRTLEIEGVGSQILRIHSTTFSSNEVGLELVRGTNNVSVRDWKVSNDVGTFKILTNNDNFSTGGDEVMRITASGYVGIGTTVPVAKLHVDGGEIADNTNDGYMMLGAKNGLNLVFSTNGVHGRNNGNPSVLHLQALGGETLFGDGNVYMGFGGGNIGIDGSAAQAKFNVDHDQFQLYFRNDQDAVNDWYLGASNDGWFSGDDRFIFSPTSSSADAILQLVDVSDNNGTVAPVIISSSGGQNMLLDGNEIDTEAGALYINHNSDQNTLINPSGGKVGVGTANPSGLLHVYSSTFGLGLQQADVTWNISSWVTGDLHFYKNQQLLSLIDYSGGGNWVALSDQRLKENISPLEPVMERISRLGVYSYHFTERVSDKRDIGVIAQELELLFPEAVSKTGERYGVAYDQLAVLAIKGVQEQQTQLEAMNAQLDALLRK